MSTRNPALLRTRMKTAPHHRSAHHAHNGCCEHEHHHGHLPADVSASFSQTVQTMDYGSAPVARMALERLPGLSATSQSVTNETLTLSLDEARTTATESQTRVARLVSRAAAGDDSHSPANGECCDHDHHHRHAHGDEQGHDHRHHHGHGASGQGHPA